MGIIPSGLIDLGTTSVSANSDTMILLIALTEV
jgi:hypothetical protein